jgi:hypothetical protein
MRINIILICKIYYIQAESITANIKLNTPRAINNTIPHTKIKMNGSIALEKFFIELSNSS